MRLDYGTPLTSTPQLPPWDTTGLCSSRQRPISHPPHAASGPPAPSHRQSWHHPYMQAGETITRPPGASSPSLLPSTSYPFSPFMAGTHFPSPRSSLHQN
eukprot:c17937_g1_i1 orf=29-328(-)